MGKANLQAEGVFEDIGNWFENDFVDFWTEDVPGAFEDAGEWLATDFVDFWENDFVNFWEQDFVDFWTEDLPEAAVDAWDWTVGAAEDVGDWFQTDFVEFWEEDFVDFWTEDVPEIATAAGDWLGQAAVDVYEGLGDAAEWIIDGDNWEAAFDTLTSSIGLLFQGEFEESWDLFTNPDAYLGEYEEIQEVKEKMGEYAKQLLAMNLDHCSSSHMSVPVLEEHKADTPSHLISTTSSVKMKSQMPQSTLLSAELVALTLSTSLPEPAKASIACTLATGKTRWVPATNVQCT